MKKLKVVFLFTLGPIKEDENTIIESLNALKDEIQDLELWLLKDEKLFEITHCFLKLVERVGVNYRVYCRESLLDIKTLEELKKDFSEHCPDIVHTYGIRAAVYGKITANKSAKFIISHDPKIKPSFVEKFVLKKADAVITASSKLLSPHKWARNILGVYLSTLSVNKQQPHQQLP